MKKFLIKLLLFVLPFLLVAYPIDKVLSRILRQSHQPTGEHEVWNDMYTGKASCEIAIYGSSRAWTHIHPLILKDSLGMEAYNFGMDAYKFQTEYLQYLEYLRNNPPPSVFILSLDIFTLERKEDCNSLMYLPYMLGNENIRRYIRCCSGFELPDFYLPLLRYRGAYDILYGASKFVHAPAYRTKGFYGRNQGWGKDVEQRLAKQGYYRISPDSATVALLHRFAEECRRKGIRLILVYTPEYVEDRQYVRNREEIMQLYRAIARQHNLPFLDYTSSSLCRDKRLFYDRIHLNARGADSFSRQLAHDLKAVLGK